MSNQIALTASMRSNLLSLKNTQSLLNKTQDRLSSGYKVNSAMDNPSSYFTAQALNSRADDLSGLLDSIGQTISTLEVADQGITTLQSFVEQAKSVANSARDTANVASKAVTDNVRFDPDNARTDLVSDYINVEAGPSVTSAMSTASLSADTTFNGLYFTASQDLKITAGDKSITYTFGAGSGDHDIALTDSVQDFLDQVNEDFGGEVNAEIKDGHVKFTAVNGGDLNVSSTVVDQINHNASTFNAGASQVWADAETAPTVKVTTATMTMQEVQINAGSNSVAVTLDDIAAAINGDETLQANNVSAYVDGGKLFVVDNTVSGTLGAPTAAAAATVTFTGMTDLPTATTPSATTVTQVNVPGSSAAEKLGFAKSQDGVAEADRTFAIRLGDATKIEGNANLRADKTLEDLGMVDGQTIDIIVGDDIHTYTIGDTGAGNEIAKTSTIQDFMDDIVYDIGRTKIKAELVDGRMSISTLDNSSLDIRSSKQTEVHKKATFSGKEIANTLADNAHLGTLRLQPSADNGASAVSIDVSRATSAKDVVNMINSNAEVKKAGMVAELDAFGNVAVYDKKAGNDGAFLTATLDHTAGDHVTAGSITMTSGYKDVELDGTSFNEVVGFKADQIVKVEDDMTVEKFRQAINNLDGIGADFDTKGHLIISGEQGDDLVLVDSKGSNVLKNLYGTDIVSVTNGSNERATYSKQFDNILTQIDELVQDTSYKGINLLNGDNLLVNFNESRTSSLDIKGVTFDSVGLGFTRSANEWISNEDIDKALNQISKATSLLRAQASEFGQNLSTVQIREDFTQNMINNLQSGADKLTLADMNEEAANMLALQTRQQLGVNSLSLASQASQSVLKLF